MRSRQLWLEAVHTLQGTPESIQEHLILSAWECVCAGEYGSPVPVSSPVFHMLHVSLASLLLNTDPPQQQSVKAAVIWDGGLFINATHVKYVLLGSIRKANSYWLPES